MAKHLKLRIYRAITTTLQSCRSKDDPSYLPQDPIPSFSRPSHANLQSSTVHFPSPQNHRSSPNHHISPALSSISCKDENTLSPEFKWQKEEKWHVVAKIYEPRPSPRRKIDNSSASSENDDFTFDILNPLTAPLYGKKKRVVKKKNKKKNLPNRLRLSTSSTDSGWFSSGFLDETEALVSSSLSCSSSEINPHHMFAKLPHRKKRATNSKRGGIVRPGDMDVEIPARLSTFKKLLPCAVDGKVKESFAIAKKSENPYEDFKSSMMDMILEKEMFEPRDLEQLLQCFLSLNSRYYHELIVQAFSEIWEAIFFSPDLHHY